MDLTLTGQGKRRVYRQQAVHDPVEGPLVPTTAAKVDAELAGGAAFE